jgi:hypothetical protein
MNQEIITQSHAARLRNVKRQAIHDLVKKGRLRVARDAQGNELAGMVYLSEVLNFKALSSRRPRLSKEQLESRNVHSVAVGEPVIWLHRPRDGYGFYMAIPATVVRTGEKRVRLSFAISASDNEQAWVKPEDIRPLYDLPYDSASDNEQLEAHAVAVLTEIQRDGDAKLVLPHNNGLV